MMNKWFQVNIYQENILGRGNRVKAWVEYYGVQFLIIFKKKEEQAKWT